jgi:hypothetical protein
MTNPGPPGEDERGLAGPGTGMGLPESGTQHATSPDVSLPVEPPTGSREFSASDDLPASQLPSDPLAPGPRVQPVPPAYDEPTELVEPVPPATTVAPATTVPPVTTASTASPSTAEAAGGALEKVKAFATRRPEVFLGAALAAGWLVGRVLSSSDGQ